MKIKKIFAYLILTIGYLVLAICLSNSVSNGFSNKFVDIAAAAVVVCVAYFVGRPSFRGVSIALFISTFLFSYVVIYVMAKTQGIKTPISFIMSETSALTFALGLLPFFTGVMVYVFCHFLSTQKPSRSG